MNFNPVRYHGSNGRRIAVPAAVLLLAVAAQVAQAEEPPQQQDHRIRVEVSGIAVLRGVIRIAVFSGPMGFPSGRQHAVASATVDAAKSTVVYEFAGLSPGEYAVSVFHDADKDGALNRNFLGIPEEGFGFSNNPRVTVGPPGYKKARFATAGGTTHIAIQLKYINTPSESD